MLKLKIQGLNNSLNDEDYMMLADNTHLYSGSDIKTLSNEAMFMPIRKCQNATKFKKLPDGYFSPVAPSDPEGIEMSMYDVPQGMLREPPVSIDDYMKALTRCKPSCCEEDLERYVDFTDKFGQEG